MPGFEQEEMEGTENSFSGRLVNGDLFLLGKFFDLFGQRVGHLRLDRRHAFVLTLARNPAGVTISIPKSFAGFKCVILRVTMIGTSTTPMRHGFSVFFGDFWALRNGFTGFGEGCKVLFSRSASFSRPKPELI
jgi:hypothetical protein